MLKQSAIALIAALLLLPASASIADDGADPKKERTELVYEGEFVDQDKQPISGVFPLVFKIYKSAKSKKALWKEKHYVAVADGRYSLTLGSTHSIPTEVANQTVYLAVELEGKEVVRQPLKAKVSGESSTGSATASTSSGSCQYCEAANDATTLQGYSPGDFASADLKQVLEAHSRDKKAHGGGGGGGSSGPIGLSNQTWTSDRVGGSGGNAFGAINCPKGYVATGMTGRHGAVIDSIQLICTKLK